MKKREWIVAFQDNEIEFINQNKDYKFIDYDSICFGKISNPQLFIEHFNNYLKQHKLHRSLFGDNMTIIHSSFWNKTDETIANAAFNYLGFSSIQFIKETTLFDEKKDTLWICCYSSYFTIHFLEEDYEKIIYFDEKVIPQNKLMIQVLKQTIKKFNSIKSIYLLGNNNIKYLQEIIEKSIKIPTYLLHFKSNYFLSQIEKS